MSPTGGTTLSRNRADESARYGTLPELAPLAMSYVPMQPSAEPSYDAAEALSRGTLFPGLDLPFMGLVNDTLPETPLNELMAIDFVCDELELYLDTHENDGEAFSLYQTMLALREEARQRFALRCGPIMQCDMLGKSEYTWLRAPWPWEYPARKEG